MYIRTSSAGKGGEVYDWSKDYVNEYKYKPGTVARVIKYFQRDRYRTPTCCLAYFTDLHRPVEGRSKPWS